MSMAALMAEREAMPNGGQKQLVNGASREGTGVDTDDCKGSTSAPADDAKGTLPDAAVVEAATLK